MKTTIDDFDRLLGAWLEDGPSAAPDAAIDAAIAHARSRPRRRDFFAFLRPAAMSTRPAFTLQPAFLLLMVGLLLAALAIAFIGSRNQRLSVVPPDSAEPSPRSVSPRPSASPSPTALHVDLVELAGNDASVDIVDLSGLLTAAVSGQPNEGGSVPEGIGIENEAPNRLRLTWTEMACDALHRLTIDVTATRFELERPACGGDLVPLDRVLILTFSQPVSAADVEGVIREGIGEALPNYTETLPDAADNRVDLELHDESGSITSLVGRGPEPGSPSAADGPVAVNESPERIIVVWAGPSCTSTATLTMDETGRRLAIVEPECPLAGGDVAEREIVLTFSGPTSADEIEVVFETSP
jgi:hypothetical protein